MSSPLDQDEPDFDAMIDSFAKAAQTAPGIRDWAEAQRSGTRNAAIPTEASLLELERDIFQKLQATNERYVTLQWLLEAIKTVPPPAAVVRNLHRLT